jgi:hypothetical protein
MLAKEAPYLVGALVVLPWQDALFVSMTAFLW